MEEIKTLGLGRWMGHFVVDFHLLQFWYEVKNRSEGLLLPVFATLAFTESGGLTGEQISRMRGMLKLPGTGMIPMQLVTAAIYHSQHFFAIVMDIQRCQAFILGKGILKEQYYIEKDVSKWGGMAIWRNTCKFLGWSVPEKKPQWWCRDWTQVNLQQWISCLRNADK